MTAYRDDEVYFHHRGKPKCGKVISTGRHGCWVDSGGERHRLRWDQVAGHKSRAPQDLKVIEHGDDGLIVENQHGERRLITIPPEARDEQLKLSPQQISGRHK